jgi:hypothetical protein
VTDVKVEAHSLDKTEMGRERNTNRVCFFVTEKGNATPTSAYTVTPKQGINVARV